MDVMQARSLIDSYADYISGAMCPVQQGDAVCLSTPMVDHDNDVMCVWVGESPHGYTVTDKGDTIGNLESSGFVFSDSRKARLEGILSGYGVSLKNDELYVDATKSDFPQRMSFLLQAMASVDDMYVLSRTSVRNLFFEDVENWMLDNGIRFVPGPSFAGQSGLQYKFDYAIGRSKSQPTRLIKAVNNPDSQGVRNALFGWKDVEASRLDCVGYAFLNSRNSKNAETIDASVHACSAYGIRPVVWGENQDEFVAELAA